VITASCVSGVLIAARRAQGLSDGAKAVIPAIVNSRDGFVADGGTSPHTAILIPLHSFHDAANMINSTIQPKISNSASANMFSNTSPREMLLSSSSPQAVREALVKWAKEDSHLDLSDIHLESHPDTVQAICDILGNPLSPIHFNKVTWGFVPDVRPVLQCLAHTTVGTFDLTKMHQLHRKSTHAHIFGFGKFVDFDALLRIKEQQSEAFKTRVIVNSMRDPKKLESLDKLRRLGVNISDVWQQSFVSDLNAGYPGNLPDWLNGEGNINLCFANDEEAKVLTTQGMQCLVSAMEKRYGGRHFQESFPRKNSLVLGRLESLMPLSEMEADRFPLVLDLSQVKVCASETDEGSSLNNHDAQRLIELMAPQFSCSDPTNPVINETFRKEGLSLKKLRIDASGMSEGTVQSLEAVCKGVGVELEITCRPTVVMVNHMIEHSVVSATPGSPIDIDAALSLKFSEAWKNDSAWWIIEEFAESPDIAKKLTPTVRQELAEYARKLIESGSILMKTYGESIRLSLSAGEAVVTAEVVGAANPDSAAGRSDGRGPVMPVQPVQEFSGSAWTEVDQALSSGDGYKVLSSVLDRRNAISEMPPELRKRLSDFAWDLYLSSPSIALQLTQLLNSRS